MLQWFVLGKVGVLIKTKQTNNNKIKSKYTVIMRIEV